MKFKAYNERNDQLHNFGIVMGLVALIVLLWSLGFFATLGIFLLLWANNAQQFAKNSVESALLYMLAEETFFMGMQIPGIVEYQDQHTHAETLAVWDAAAARAGIE